MNTTSTTRFYNDIKLYKTYIPRLLWEHTPPCVCVRVCTCTMYLKLYTLLHVAKVEFHQLVHKLDQFLQRNRIQLFTTNNTIASSCSLQTTQSHPTVHYKQHNRMQLLIKNNTIGSSCSPKTTQSRPAAHYKRPNISTFKGTTTVYWIAWENSTCQNYS